MQPVLDLIDSAAQSIRVADYSYNLPALTMALVAKHKAGVDVALVLDHSQAAGTTEKPQVAALVEAGVP
jgi:hypothetical protein